MIIAILVRHHL